MPADPSDANRSPAIRRKHWNLAVAGPTPRNRAARPGYALCRYWTARQCFRWTVSSWLAGCSWPVGLAGRDLPDDLAGILVVPQSLEPWMAQFSSIGPFAERDLADELRLGPVHT